MLNGLIRRVPGGALVERRRGEGRRTGRRDEPTARRGVDRRRGGSNRSEGSGEGDEVDEVIGWRWLIATASSVLG
jgi:hypothetical protein